METFNFSYHRVSIEYDNVDNTIQLGNGWTFTSEGDSPIRRKFVLNLTGFKYYYNPDGSYDNSTNENINNLRALEEFYRRHRTYKRFTYPVHGGAEEVTVRFEKPIKMPEGIPNGGGAVSPFKIEFIEVP